MKRVLFLCLIVGGSVCPAAEAQINCASTSVKLACLIPNALNLTAPSSQNLGFLNEAIAGQVSDLPLASPASGIIYVNDPRLNLPVPSNETLGPVLTQRAETIGRHKFYIATTYQFFRFGDMDGLSLKQLPILLNLQGASTVTTTNNRLDLTVNQVAMFLTFGLTDKVDLSIAIPVLDVHEQFTTSGVEYSSSNVQTFQNVAKSGSASGLGDEVLAVKGTVWKPMQGGLAIGAELRLPTGDVMNFLGSGTIGFKPFASLTYGKRVAAHVNIAYEVNGHSVLVTDSQGNEARLPDRLLYSGGVDWGATKWITVAADVMAQRVMNPERVQIVNQTLTNPILTTQTIEPFRASYNRTDGSIGIKVKALRNLIASGNLLVALDHSGLRARLVPLVGLSYTF